MSESSTSRSRVVAAPRANGGASGRGGGEGMRMSRRSSRGMDTPLRVEQADTACMDGMSGSVELGAAGKGKKREMEEDTYAWEEGRPTATLPGLLSHLSLTPSFLLPFTNPSSASEGQRAFSFTTATPSTSSYPLLFPPSSSHSTRPNLVRSKSAEHKRNPSPHPHLLQNTKKLKRLHNFYRSETLLFGPTPSPFPLLSPSPSPIPFLPSHRTTPPRPPAKRVYVPLLTRQPASYWSSISLSSGTGRSSRMAPDEGVWVGTGLGWSTSFDLLRPISSKVQGHPLARLGQRSGSSAMARSGHSVGGAGRGAGERAEPPLKSALLAILRTRMAESGGSSRGAEAGLRFRKWVVWNSWMKKGEAESTTSAGGMSPLQSEPDYEPSSEPDSSSPRLSELEEDHVDVVVSESDAASMELEQEADDDDGCEYTTTPTQSSSSTLTATVTRTTLEDLSPRLTNTLSTVVGSPASSSSLMVTRSGVCV